MNQIKNMLFAIPSAIGSACHPSLPSGLPTIPMPTPNAIPLITEPIRLGVPRNLEVTADYLSLRLTFDFPLNRTAITGFQITTFPETVITKVSGTTNEVLLKNLDYTEDYIVRVQSIGAQGKHSTVVSTTETVTPLNPLNPPLSFSAAPGNATVVLTWANPTINTLESDLSSISGSVTPTTYIVKARPTGNSNPNAISLFSVASSYNIKTIISLTNATQYSFSISSSNTYAQSVYTSEITATPTTSLVLPIVESVSLTGNFTAQFFPTGRVLSTGNTDILEVGFVYQLNDSSITSGTVSAMGALPDPITDIFTKTISAGGAGTVYMKAYATNSVGTSYGRILSAQVSLCLIEGTLITLADKTTKLIEDVRYGDRLLVYNFDQGKFDTSTILWMKETETSSCYNEFTFDDGTKLGTISQHRIFNKEKGEFTYPMTDDTPIGTTTFTHEGKEIKLIKKDIITEPIKNYNIITDTHFNLFGNGILTSFSFNNMYPIKDMKFVKTVDHAVSFVEDSNIIRDALPAFIYDGFRIKENLHKMPMDKMLEGMLFRLSKQKKNKILFLDHNGVMFTGNHSSPGDLDKENFAKENVDALNQILAKHEDCEIVVSSDWKHWVASSLPKIQDYYKKQNIIQMPIGLTDNLIPSTPVENISYAQQRALEIQSWIKNNASRYNMSSYLVIDDLDLRPYFSEKHFVYIDQPLLGIQNYVSEIEQKL